jgi:hypothetical protein
MPDHVFRTIRRRHREARYVGDPSGPRQWARWGWGALVYDLRVLAEVLGGPR